MLKNLCLLMKINIDIVRIQITHDEYESSGYGEYMRDYLVFGISKGGLSIDDC